MVEILLKSSTCEKDLGILMDHKLNMSQWYNATTKKISNMLKNSQEGHRIQIMGSNYPDLPCLGLTSLEVLFLVMHIQFKKDIDELEQVQRTAIKMVKGLLE